MTTPDVSDVLQRLIEKWDAQSGVRRGVSERSIVTDFVDDLSAALAVIREQQKEEEKKP